MPTLAGLFKLQLIQALKHGFQSIFSNRSRESVGGVKSHRADSEASHVPVVGDGSVSTDIRADIKLEPVDVPEEAIRVMKKVEIP